MKKRADPVMSIVLRRLISKSDPSSPISNNPTEIVMLKTSSPQMMTISVGFLEIGELGSDLEISLLKTMLITGSALFFMALVGFNTAFAPTINGVIGNPLYNGLFLGGSSTSIINGPLASAWWSQQSAGLTTGTYFLFETAFASVTLALVGVIVLRKMKMQAFFAYSIVYFIIIWNLPAAWIWNPTGWLAQMGMADFAGGLV